MIVFICYSQLEWNHGSLVSITETGLFCEPKESNSGGEADFLTKLKSSECEPKESNSGGEADFLTKLKSSEWC
jgi:hypothetical protein